MTNLSLRQLLDGALAVLITAGVAYHIRERARWTRRDANAQRELRIDQLTTIPNRRSFMEALEEARRTPETCTLVLIDLDAFKAINDELGHGVGDQVLIAVAHTLSRAADAARLSGDEFAVLLPIPLEAAHSEVTAWMEWFPARGIWVRDSLVSLALSAGLTTVTSTVSASELMRRADLALYASKQSRRPEVWHGSMQPRTSGGGRRRRSNRDGRA